MSKQAAKRLESYQYDQGKPTSPQSTQEVEDEDMHHLLQNRKNQGVLTLTNESKSQAGFEAQYNRTLAHSKSFQSGDEALERPCWNSSRKKLVAIWLPIQLLSIVLITYLSVRLIRRS